MTSKTAKQGRHPIVGLYINNVITACQLVRLFEYLAIQRKSAYLALSILQLYAD